MIRPDQKHKPGLKLHADPYLYGENDETTIIYKCLDFFNLLLTKAIHNDKATAYWLDNLFIAFLDNTIDPGLMADKIEQLCYPLTTETKRLLREDLHLKQKILSAKHIVTLPKYHLQVNLILNTTKKHDTLAGREAQLQYSIYRPIKKKQLNGTNNKMQNKKHDLPIKTTNLSTLLRIKEEKRRLDQTQLVRSWINPYSFETIPGNNKVKPEPLKNRGRTRNRGRTPK